MTGLLDVVAHLDNELKMPHILVKIGRIPTLLLKYLNILLYLHEVPVDSVNLLFPLKGVYFRFDYLVVLVGFVVVVKASLLRIEEVHFGFFYLSDY